MKDGRWLYLMNDDQAPLSEDEIHEGWHFCREFDGLLVGPGMSELNVCLCLDPDHPAYATAPKTEAAIINENDF